jgi:hypothetical protein
LNDDFFSDDDQVDGGVSHLPNGTIHSQKSQRPSTMGPRPPGTTNGLSLDLPVDDEDYLVPEIIKNVFSSSSLTNKTNKLERFP